MKLSTVKNKIKKVKIVLNHPQSGLDHSQIRG